MWALTIAALACLVVGTTGVASSIEVSVKDYAAKGDGKTDDRLAIQAAIDAVSKAGGGMINFPDGIYLVTAPNKSAW
ncbi:MAG: glycosyl hydrolase family 28-related protein, partial [Dehalococcoidia bacterium]